MRSLNEALSTTSVDVIPVKKAFSISNANMTIGELYEEFSELIYDEMPGLIQAWFKKNSRKRNVRCKSTLKIKYSRIPFRPSKIYNDTINEFERIGGTWTAFHDDPYDNNIKAEYYCMVPSLSASKDITIDRKCTTNKNVEPPHNYTNGYNDLPGGDIDIMINDIMSCADSYECVVSSDKDESDTPIDITITLRPVYNDRKLKKVYDKFINDRRLQQFASRLDHTSKGISAYYASKGSGDYTGD